MNNDTNTQEPIIRLDERPADEAKAFDELSGSDKTDRIMSTTRDGSVPVGHEVEVNEVSEPEQTAA